MALKVGVIIEKDKDGNDAYCPELEGCQPKRESYEEGISHIKKAIDCISKPCPK